MPDYSYHDPYAYSLFQELEEYTEHLRQKCEERVRELDDEVKTLKEDLEALLAGTQAVGTMLLNEGLEDVAQSTLGEQVCDMTLL